MTEGPSTSSSQMLYLLNRMARQGYNMYLGTVPAKVKARRRAANKVAKRSRKINRHG